VTHDASSTAPTPLRRLAWLSDACDGQVLIIFALFSLVLIGALALSIDAGYLMSERRQVQSSADAGALAAAKAALDSKPSAEIIATGAGYATYNAGTGATAVVNKPPTSGAHAGDTNYIQVTVTKNVSRFFIGAVYNGAWQVSATATAGIEPEGFNAALLALNSNAGGIQTGGSTNINVVGGSAVSNYKIDVSGSTSITADEWVVANDGFKTSGSWTIKGTQGTNPSGAEVPDPLASKISPPSLPAAPGNPVATVTPGGAACRTYPGSSPAVYSVPSGTYSNCTINVQNVPSGQTMQFVNGQYRFQSNAKITTGGSNTGDIVFRGGTFNFVGGNGISVNGTTSHFEMDAGSYSFTNGATINLGGSANDNNFCVGSGSASGCTMYFSCGGGIEVGGSNSVTLNPGTYIFDGGAGLDMSGSDNLTFSPGNYVMWFLNGADLSFSGSSRISTSSSVHAIMYFYGASGNGWSDLDMSGSTSFNIPTGEYYFDHGRFLNSGSTTIKGDSVLLYFKNGGYLSSTGSASFGFTAPTTTVYTGYYPGVFMYSDASNTASFEWHGSTSSVSKGAIYLPSSPLLFGGSSNGKTIEGQVIVDRMLTGGSTGLTVQFVEYVKTQTPKVWLVE
jgi:Flp pilus assembly protein TadG